MASSVDRQHVWDLPTRIFHWLLVVLLGFSWWSAESDPLTWPDHMEWHRISGVTVFGLIVFRILWGLFGTSTARFGQFLRGPRAVWSYVRPSGFAQAVAIGHNPLGGWAVILMLLLLCVQVGTGLLAVDVDGIESGPLSHLVTFDQGRTAASVHEFSFNLLVAIVILHVIAVLFYLVVMRRDLIGPMVTGFRRAPEGGGATSAALASRWKLAVAVLITVLLAYGVANGFRF